MTVEIFAAADARMREALRVRFAVFVDEQQVPPELEIDAYDAPEDAASAHALVRRDGEAVAAGRFYRRDASTAQIGRMAVLAPVRGEGVGTALLRALLDEARRRGYRSARLSAQTHAVAFYERHGFRSFGEPYDDAGIPHVDMAREL